MGVKGKFTKAITGKMHTWRFLFKDLFNRLFLLWMKGFLFICVIDLDFFILDQTVIWFIVFFSMTLIAIQISKGTIPIPHCKGFFKEFMLKSFCICLTFDQSVQKQFLNICCCITCSNILIDNEIILFLHNMKKCKMDIISTKNIDLFGKWHHLSMHPK